MKKVKTMMENQLTNKLICQAAEDVEIHAKTYGLGLISHEEFTEKLQSMADFFGVTTLDALLLVPFITARIRKNSAVERSEVIEWLRLELHDALMVTARLNALVVQGSLSRVHCDYHASDGYKLSNKAYQCLLENLVFVGQNTPVKKTVFTFLETCKNLIDIVDGESFGYEKLSEEIMNTIGDYKSVKQIERLKKLKLNEKELITTIGCLCIQMLDDNDSVDVERVLRALCIPFRSVKKMVSQINDGDSTLIQQNILRHASGNFKTATKMSLTDDFIFSFTGIKKKKKIRNFEMGSLLNESAAQQLFYNHKEAKEIERLTQLLQEDMYKKVRTELSQQGNATGISVLLFGGPGTGKTSTALNIAAKTGRKIYKVDVEKVLSAYVGESEKNIISIFSSYEELLAAEAKAPILLLNECDGLLKKRVSGANGNSAVSEMMNTMVTLLLDKLDSFDGILFATMNQPVFDEAFDRRFLLKLELTPPDINARTNIIRNKFNDLSNKTIESMACDYNLTGGHISNIRKKLTMRTLLEPALSIDECAIELCEQEFVLRSNTGLRTISGFSLPKTQSDSLNN
jgi:hypothetical protein